VKKLLDVISVGSANIDTIARIDQFPEADGLAPVQSLKTSFGGSAANTAIACSKLGLKTGFLGKIGSDNAGRELFMNFQKNRVDTNGLIYNPEVPSGQVFIAVENLGQKIMFSFPGAPQTLSREDVNTRISYLAKAYIVHLASLKSTDPFEEIAAHAVEGDYLLSLNPGTTIASLGYERLQPILDSLDILIVSRNELQSMFGHSSIEDNVKYCFSKTAVKMLVVTFGVRGSNFYFPDVTGNIVPIFKVQTVNTTGAGDAFSAGFFATFLTCFKEYIENSGADCEPCRTTFEAFANGMKEDNECLSHCLLFANATAAFVVQGDGAQVNLPTYEMVDEFMSSQASGE
jgi:ribokinase